MISFLSYCDGGLYLFLLVLVVLPLERGINFVCCSTRCFVAQMETMTAGTVSILHLDTNLPQSHHHHQICTRPMGFEHQSTLQSSHPVISINEHHRINQSETKILKNRFISDSSEIGNFEKNSYLWNMIDAIYKNPAEVNFQLENVHQLFASKIHICPSDHATSDQLEFFFGTRKQKFRKFRKPKLIWQHEIWICRNSIFSFGLFQTLFDNEKVLDPK